MYCISSCPVLYYCDWLLLSEICFVLFFLQGAGKQMCHIWLHVRSSGDNGNQPNNVGSCLSFLCQELWVMHHLLKEANYSHLQLCVQLKVLRNNSRVITEVLFCFVLFFLLQRQRKMERNKEKDEEKGEVYLRVFGDPVTQHIQDSVCGSSSDNKFFVPISLVCRKTWKQISWNYSQTEFPYYMALSYVI